jgi:hypothetical protein
MKADKERIKLTKTNQQSKERIMRVNTLNKSTISKYSDHSPNRTSFLNPNFSCNYLNSNVFDKLSQMKDDGYHLKVYYPARNQINLKTTKKV